MSDYIEELIKEVEIKLENNLRGMFLKHNITEDYILSHLDEFQIIQHDNVKTFLWKDVELFKEIITTEMHGGYIFHKSEFIDH